MSKPPFYTQKPKPTLEELKQFSKSLLPDQWIIVDGLFICEGKVMNNEELKQFFTDRDDVKR